MCMHADFHSEAKHLSLNKFRVTMDTAHATSAVGKERRKKIKIRQKNTS